MCLWCTSLLTYVAVFTAHSQHNTVVKVLQYDRNGAAERTHFQLLVLYAYFESESIPFCEKIMKRTNLANFINAGVSQSPNVTYLFSVSGVIPKAVELYSSIGLDSPYGDNVFPNFANVLVRNSKRSDVPDLCQHAISFNTLRGKMEYSHVLFLNDGVRGPFDTTKSSAVSLQGAPGWIQSHLALLHSEPNIGAVGSVMSCELTLHLQGWFVLVRTILFAKHVNLFEEACQVESWNAAIGKETAFSSAILRDGFKLGTLFPERLVIGNRGFTAAMRSRLNDCSNPSSAFRRLHGQNGKLDLEQVRFLKIGGGFYRYDVLTNATKLEINKFTLNKLGVDHTDYYCFRNSRDASNYRTNAGFGQNR